MRARRVDKKGHQPSDPRVLSLLKLYGKQTGGHVAAIVIDAATLIARQAVAPPTAGTPQGMASAKAGMH